MKNQKGFAQLILILVVVIITIGGAYYFGTLKNKTNLPQATSNLFALPVPLEKVEDPTENWNIHKSDVLGIEFKLPKSLGLLEMSGKEISGDNGTQYCMIYVGPISLSIVKSVKAGGGACGGGIFNIGTLSKDYIAGREGGFGDMNGYVKEGGNYSARFTNKGSFSLSKDLVQEITNKNGVVYLKIKGESKMADYGGEQMKITTLGTPGEGNIGALFNISNNKYYGFGVSMEIKDPKDELTFDQILSTFKFIE